MRPVLATKQSRWWWEMWRQQLPSQPCAYCPSGHAWEDVAGATCPVCGAESAGESTPPRDDSPASNTLFTVISIAAFLTLLMALDGTVRPLTYVALYLGLAALAGVTIWSIRARRQCIERRVRSAAGELRMAYSPAAHPLLQRRLNDLPFFQEGFGRQFMHLLQGTIARRETIAGWATWLTSGGKSSVTHYRFVAVLLSPPPELPTFRLRPEFWPDKLKALFIGNDIDFHGCSDDVTFSRTCDLRGPDEVAIRERFTHAVRAWFVSHPGWEIDADERHLLVTRNVGRTPSQGDVEAIVRTLGELAALFSLPRTLSRSRRGGRRHRFPAAERNSS